MKTIFTFLFVLGFSIVASSQTFGLRVGATINDMKVATDSIQYNTRVKPGFIAGVTLEFPLKNNMAINTSINFKSMGTWLIKNDEIVVWRSNYIDLNLTYMYIIPLEKLDIFFEGGGYAGYALYGKEIIENENGTSETRDLKIGTTKSPNVNEADDLTPYDVGLVIGGGVRFGSYTFSASFQPSIVNISNVDHWWYGNRVGTLCFAYHFKK